MKGRGVLAATLGLALSRCATAMPAINPRDSSICGGPQSPLTLSAQGQASLTRLTPDVLISLNDPNVISNLLSISAGLGDVKPATQMTIGGTIDTTFTEPLYKVLRAYTNCQTIQLNPSTHQMNVASLTCPVVVDRSVQDYLTSPVAQQVPDYNDWNSKGHDEQVKILKQAMTKAQLQGILCSAFVNKSLVDAVQFDVLSNLANNKPLPDKYLPVVAQGFEQQGWKILGDFLTDEENHVVADANSAPWLKNKTVVNALQTANDDHRKKIGAAVGPSVAVGASLLGLLAREWYLTQSLPWPEKYKSLPYEADRVYDVVRNGLRTFRNLVSPPEKAVHFDEVVDVFGPEFAAMEELSPEQHTAVEVLLRTAIGANELPFGFHADADSEFDLADFDNEASEVDTDDLDKLDDSEDEPAEPSSDSGPVDSDSDVSPLDLNQEPRHPVSDASTPLAPAANEDKQGSSMPANQAAAPGAAPGGAAVGGGGVVSLPGLPIINPFNLVGGGRKDKHKHKDEGKASKKAEDEAKKQAKKTKDEAKKQAKKQKEEAEKQAKKQKDEERKRVKAGEKARKEEEDRHKKAEKKAKEEREKQRKKAEQKAKEEEEKKRKHEEEEAKKLAAKQKEEEQKKGQEQAKNGVPSHCFDLFRPEPMPPYCKKGDRVPEAGCLDPLTSCVYTFPGVKKMKWPPKNHEKNNQALADEVRNKGVLVDCAAQSRPNKPNACRKHHHSKDDLCLDSFTGCVVMHRGKWPPKNWEETMASKKGLGH